MKSKTTKTLLLALGTACMALNAGVVAAQPMKIAHVVPPGDPRDLGAHEVADLLAADESCEIEATVYPSGQLGGTTDLIEGMQIGSIEAVVLPASFLVGFEPKIGIFDFPFFWPTDEEKLIELQKGEAMANLLASTEEQDVVSLAAWHTGYKEWTGNKPLQSLDDYAGLKARVMPSPVLVEQQTLLGLNPVNMPFSETYSALQNGTIDAQENPLVTSYVMKFYEVQSDITMTNHGNLDQIFMVSKPWYDALSEDCQTAVRNAAVSAGQLVADKTDEMTSTAMDAFAKAGVAVHELSDEQYAALKEATLPGVEAFYVEQVGPEGQEIIDSFKAEMGTE
ncbi:TRAP transporter substrate-binding protein [Martelella limonii]|uniref:TRAP transporter substrate-binding protein n=1 Tax=Martelella limonii TaxID=1647649 RepID=UPI001580245B|nr:TRAP transporter substrate-binding protein [Martelella limonii]